MGCDGTLRVAPKAAGGLNNELYVGRYAFNRSKWIKNPNTGERERLIRPETEWQSVARPALRMLDEALWLAVRERMASPRRAGGRRGRGGVPTTLLAGIMRCGYCGGSL